MHVQDYPAFVPCNTRRITSLPDSASGSSLGRYSANFPNPAKHPALAEILAGFPDSNKSAMLPYKALQVIFLKYGQIQN